MLYPDRVPEFVGRDGHEIELADPPRKTGTTLFGQFGGERGVVVEVRKVVWPNRQETTQTTMIVVFTVIVVAFILWGLDSGLSFIVQGVIG